MRCLVLSQPGPMPPPSDQMPRLVDAFVAWRDKYRAKMEAFEFFAGRPGGFGIVNVRDEAELSQIMMEFPWAPFSEIKIDLIVSGDTGLKQLKESVAQMAMAGTR